jgi:Zn-dependent protease
MILIQLLAFVVALVPAMLFHELAHGWAAVRLGDPTPRWERRLTLNLKEHLDPFGSVVMPLLLLLLVVLAGRPLPVFGYLKPMPVRLERLGRPSRVVLVALAGPVANLLLATLGAVGLRWVGLGGGVLSVVLAIWVFVNVSFVVIHLLPIPPLDMAKVVGLVLPPRAREVYASMEQYGALFMLLIFFLLPFLILGIVNPAVEGLQRVLLG